METVDHVAFMQVIMEMVRFRIVYIVSFERKALLHFVGVSRISYGDFIWWVIWDTGASCSSPYRRTFVRHPRSRIKPGERIFAIQFPFANACSKLGMARLSSHMETLSVQRRQHSHREQSRHLGAAIGDRVRFGNVSSSTTLCRNNGRLERGYNSNRMTIRAYNNGTVHMKAVLVASGWVFAALFMPFQRYLIDALHFSIQCQMIADSFPSDDYSCEFQLQAPSFNSAFASSFITITHVKKGQISP